MAKPTGDQLIENYPYDIRLVGSTLGGIILFCVFMGLTYGHVVWYQSEYLALEIRAAGSAIATASCWLANLVVSVAYLTQLKSLGASGTYGLYLGFISVGYVFVYFCYPETKELSLEETNLIFQDDFGVKKAQEMLKEKKVIAAALHNSS